MALDFDRPMALGDHLEELRTRLIRVVVVLGLGVIIGMIFQVEIKWLFEQPLRRAVELSDPEAVKRIGLPTDPAAPIFKLFHMAESALNAVKVSFCMALAIAFPVLIHQAWGFITPGLKRNEKAVGFLFVPAAVLFFYAGILFGYFLGLPFLYKLLIEWTANENAILDLRQSYYLSFFFTMTFVFGLVMDIPWLIMVLVRMRVLTPAQIAGKRRYILLVGTVLAAVATPPDPISQLTLLALMVVLFEGGLAASRLLYKVPELVTDEAADSVPSGADNDGRAPWDDDQDSDPDPGPDPDGDADMGIDPQPDDDATDDDAEDDPVARESAWDRAARSSDDGQDHTDDDPEDATGSDDTQRRQPPEEP